MNLIDDIDSIKGNVFSFGAIAASIGVICISYHIISFVVSRMKVINILLR